MEERLESTYCQHELERVKDDILMMPEESQLEIIGNISRYVLEERDYTLFWNKTFCLFDEMSDETRSIVRLHYNWKPSSHTGFLSDIANDLAMGHSDSDATKVADELYYLIHPQFKPKNT